MGVPQSGHLTSKHGVPRAWGTFFPHSGHRHSPPGPRPRPPPMPLPPPVESWPRPPVIPSSPVAMALFLQTNGFFNLSRFPIPFNTRVFSHQLDAFSVRYCPMAQGEKRLFHMTPACRPVPSVFPKPFTGSWERLYFSMITDIFPCDQIA